MLTAIGLLLNLLGTVLLGMATLKGIETMVVAPDWGSSPIKWRSPTWQRMFAAGWVTLPLGYLLQLLALFTHLRR